MHWGQLPWADQSWGAGAGTEGHRSTSVISDKHLNLHSPAPLWSKFPSTMLIPCRLFMPFVLFVKPVSEIPSSVTYLNPQKRVHMFSIFPLHSMAWVDHHGFVKYNLCLKTSVFMAGQ